MVDQVVTSQILTGVESQMTKLLLQEKKAVLEKTAQS